MKELNLITQEASVLHMLMLHYITFVDNPCFEHIIVFRKEIEELSNENDKEQLKAFFEERFSGLLQNMTSHRA